MEQVPCLDYVGNRTVLLFIVTVGDGDVETQFHLLITVLSMCLCSRIQQFSFVDLCGGRYPSAISKREFLSLNSDTVTLWTQFSDTATRIEETRFLVTKMGPFWCPRHVGRKTKHTHGCLYGFT